MDESTCTYSLKYKHRSGLSELKASERGPEAWGTEDTSGYPSQAHPVSALIERQIWGGLIGLDLCIAKASHFDFF